LCWLSISKKKGVKKEKDKKMMKKIRKGKTKKGRV
jgi:hypothetical protein